MIRCKEFITPTIFPSQKRGCSQDRWRSLTMTKKEKDINDINYQVTSYFTSIHCKINPYKFSPLSIHFFRPLDCDANPCKNGGTCVEVPSTKTYKCNCTDAFTGKNCSESTTVAQSTDASREYSKIHFFLFTFSIAKISHELNLSFLMMPLQWPKAAYSLTK